MDAMRLCIGLDETKILSIKFLGASNFCTIQTCQGVFYESLCVNENHQIVYYPELYRC